jgi:hypothetical protein
MHGSSCDSERGTLSAGGLLTRLSGLPVRRMGRVSFARDRGRRSRRCVPSLPIHTRSGACAVAYQQSYVMRVDEPVTGESPPQGAASQGVVGVWSVPNLTRCPSPRGKPAPREGWHPRASSIYVGVTSRGGARGDYPAQGV